MREIGRAHRWPPEATRGHSTLAMVKRYHHVLPGLTIAAAERMDHVMGR